MAGALAAPFFHLLSGRAVGAGEGPRRLVIFGTGNGCAPSGWRFERNDPLEISPGSVLEPLRGLESHLLPITNLTIIGNQGHDSMATMLCGQSLQSVDQWVGNAIGEDTQFRTVELGVDTAWPTSEATRTRMVRRGNVLVAPNDIPKRAAERVFGHPGDLYLRSRRSSALDVAHSELEDLRSRLGAEEQARLDVHLDSVRDIERGLFGEVCEAPPLSFGGEFPDELATQLDIAAHALACESTRVVTVQASVSASSVRMGWLGHTENHHALSHQYDTTTFEECQQWYALQFRGLLDRLLALPDATTGRPLLDDTIVMWVSEMGDGRLHSATDGCWLLAGAGLRTGRRIDARSSGQNADVLYQVAQLLGAHDVPFGGAGQLEALS